MFNVQIPVMDLVLFILFCLAGAVGVYLIITLKNFNQLLKRVDKIVEANDRNINSTLSTLPEVVKNVNDVTVNVKSNIEKVSSAVETLEDAVCETAATVSEGTEGIFNFVRIAGDVFRIVLGMFTASKKQQ